MLSGRASRRKTSIHHLTHMWDLMNTINRGTRQIQRRGRVDQPAHLRKGVVGEKRSTNGLPGTHAQPWTCPAMDGQQGSEGPGGESGEEVSGGEGASTFNKEDKLRKREEALKRAGGKTLQR